MSGTALAAPDVARLAAETSEIDMLLESTQAEAGRARGQEERARAEYDKAKQRGQVPATAADAYVSAVARRMTMDGQVAVLQAKRSLLDRAQALLAAAAPADGETARLDDARVLQAVVDTQEEERGRIARQVHDGPAQAMANVVLQSEISERLFAIDAARAREELAALRTMVKRTLQDLRGFIFELRPMILDDLGLVPTLRRYIQTLVDRHGVGVAFSSTGRDRRLSADREVAIFRLIQDTLLERIERAEARSLAVTTAWRDEELEIVFESDGRELPPDEELASGLRRSERIQLLGGTWEQRRGDGSTTLLSVRLPAPVRAGV